MSEIQSVQELLRTAAPVINAARGDEARMNRLRNEPLQVLAEAGIHVPAAARATLPNMLNRVITVAAMGTSPLPPVGGESMTASLGASTLVHSLGVAQPGLEQQLLACARQAEATVAARPVEDFAIPLAPRTVLVLPRTLAPVSDVRLSSAATAVSSMSTSPAGAEVPPGTAEVAQLRGLLCALRAGYEVGDEPTMGRLVLLVNEIIKAIELADKPENNVNQFLPWLQTMSSIRGEVSAVLEKARAGDWVKYPGQLAPLDWEINRMIKRIYDARGKVWTPPDVEFSTHWHGMVLTLSPKSVKALAEGLETAASIAEKVASAAGGKVGAVLKLVELILTIYAKVLAVMDRGNGVYLTCCWWSLPPLMLPPPPFFPTPV
jgi:hypothetical protein